MQKLLIFGSNGLLGQNLVKRFIDEFNIFAASLEADNYIPDLIGQYDSLDFSNRSQTKELIERIKPDVIINAAAFTNVDACEDEREKCWAANVRAVENILESAGPYKPVLVHISTDYVFDGFDGPYRETDQPNPRGNYARSKRAAENIIQSGNLEYLIIRTQVLYGTGRNVRPNFVTWLIDQLGSGKKARIVDDQIGNPSYAPDVSEAIFRLLAKKRYGLFHVSSPDSVSRYDFARLICQVFDLDEELIERTTSDQFVQKAPRPMNSSFVIDKLVNYTGWEPHKVHDALILLKKELEATHG